VLEGFLKLAPVKIDTITRTAINGSWFNFFMCSSSGYVVLPVTGPGGTETGIQVPAGNGLATGQRGCS
jgi:phospholipid/cholesterol/gamma-HCH transport system substrate-binding protein